MERENGITVKRLLEAPILHQATVVAGHGGLSNVITRANTFADYEILDWVSAHEILLMTDLNYRGWTGEELTVFVRKCSELKLAALAVKPSVPGDSLPQELIREADALDLPVILIDPVTSISDVGSEVFSQIFSLQAKLLRKHEDLYEQLLKTLSEGGGIRDVLRIVHQATGNPVVFHYADRHEAVIVGAADEAERDALRADARAFMQKYPRRPTVHESRVDIGAQKQIKRMTVPVTSKHFVQGTIFIWGTVNELQRFDLSAIESVSTSIALLIMQEKSLREVEIKHSSEFIDDLLSGTSRDDALDRARIYNLNIEDDFLMLLIRFTDSEDEREEKKLEYSSKVIYDFIYDHLRRVTSTLRTHRLHGLVTTRRADIQVLIAVDEEKEFTERVDAFAEEIVRQFKLKATGGDPVNLRVGIGKIYSHMKNVWRSYADADKTLIVGSRLYDRPILRFSDLGIFRILVQGELNDELEEYFRETLRSLLEYDKKKSTELVRTLEVYFRNNNNINKTSEELFTHYNTVLYRLERIQEITGLDLSNANDRLNLELAMKLRSLYMN